MAGRIRQIAATFLLLSLMVSAAVAQDEKPLESHVKAVYLFNFASFVEWPEEAFADSSAPFTIGILGVDPFDGVLEQVVAGEKVKDRDIVIRQSNRAEDMMGCQIVYTAEKESERLRSSLDRFKTLNVLTVGEGDGFARSIGIIGFVRQKNKVRFEINMKHADRAQLKVSSKLQKVASSIFRD